MNSTLLSCASQRSFFSSLSEVTGMVVTEAARVADFVESGL